MIYKLHPSDKPLREILADVRAGMKGGTPVTAMDLPSPPTWRATAVNDLISALTDAYAARRKSEAKYQELSAAVAVASEEDSAAFHACQAATEALLTFLKAEGQGDAPIPTGGNS